MVDAVFEVKWATLWLRSCVVKRPQECCIGSSQQEPVWDQVSKKAEGTVACVSSSGAAGAGQGAGPCAGQRCGHSWSAVCRCGPWEAENHGGAAACAEKDRGAGQGGAAQGQGGGAEGALAWTMGGSQGTFRQTSINPYMTVLSPQGPLPY